MHAVTLQRLTLQKPGTNVHRYRIETATVHDACATLMRRFFMKIDHAPNPLHLAGEVAIVGAVCCAGRDQRRSVVRVRPNGCNNDTGALHQFLHGSFVQAVGNEARKRVGTCAQGFA